jgi:hypothetical protein
MLSMMLHDHVHYSHFPQFDRLEQILINWPKLFEHLPIGTQPLHVEDGTVIMLCQTRPGCSSSVISTTTWSRGSAR